VQGISKSYNHVFISRAILFWLSFPWHMNMLPHHFWTSHFSAPYHCLAAVALRPLQESSGCVNLFDQCAEYRRASTQHCPSHTNQASLWCLITSPFTRVVHSLNLFQSEKDVSLMWFSHRINQGIWNTPMLKACAVMNILTVIPWRKVLEKLIVTQSRNTHILWNPKFHYGVHRNTPLDHTLSQINPLYVLICCLHCNCFNNNLDISKPHMNVLLCRLACPIPSTFVYVNPTYCAWCMSVHISMFPSFHSCLSFHASFCVSVELAICSCSHLCGTPFKIVLSVCVTTQE
jgi:hypothetical protein